MERMVKQLQQVHSGFMFTYCVFPRGSDVALDSYNTAFEQMIRMEYGPTFVY